MAAANAIKDPIKGQAYRLYWEIVDAASPVGNPINGGLVTVSATISKDGSSFAATTSTPVEIGTTGRGYLELTASEMNADAVWVIVTSLDETGVQYRWLVNPLDLTETGDHWRDATVPRFEQGLLHVVMWRANQAEKRYSDGLLRQYDHTGTLLYTQAYTSYTDTDLQKYEKRGRIG